MEEFEKFEELCVRREFGDKAYIFVDWPVKQSGRKIILRKAADDVKGALHGGSVGRADSSTMEQRVRASRSSPYERRPNLRFNIRVMYGDSGTGLPLKKRQKDVGC